MKMLVTGNAGFIGFHTVLQLLSDGHDVVGLDSLNDYYDPELKKRRLELTYEKAKSSKGTFQFYNINLADLEAMRKCFDAHSFDRVINLAAQAGVRYSLENPQAYVESNLTGFTNLIDLSARAGVGHFVYASTSSVYGMNTAMPFSESNTVDHPLQFYAATKRANELMAHSYSNLYRLPTTGLRFFTVYGPWGRPDMALFLFTKNMLEGKPIKVFNYGQHSRDFTFVTDIVAGVVAVTDQPALPDPEWSSADPNPNTSSVPFRIYNIGNNSPVKLMEYIEAIEEVLGIEAERELLPLQPGDVPNTYANVDNLKDAVDYKPKVSVKDGVRQFVEWYREYYSV